MFASCKICTRSKLTITNYINLLQRKHDDNDGKNGTSLCGHGGHKPTEREYINYSNSIGDITTGICDVPHSLSLFMRWFGSDHRTDWRSSHKRLQNKFKYIILWKIAYEWIYYIVFSFICWGGYWMVLNHQSGRNHYAHNLHQKKASLCFQFGTWNELNIANTLPQYFSSSPLTVILFDANIIPSPNHSHTWFLLFIKPSSPKSHAASEHTPQPADIWHIQPFH